MEKQFLTGLTEGLTKKASPSKQAAAEADSPEWFKKFIGNFSEPEKEAVAEAPASVNPMAAIREKLGFDKVAEVQGGDLSLMDKLREKLGMSKEAKDKDADEKKAKEDGKKKDKDKEEEDKEEEEKEASASNVFELWKESEKKPAKPGNRFEELKARLAAGK